MVDDMSAPLEADVPGGCDEPCIQVFTYLGQVCQQAYTWVMRITQQHEDTSAEPPRRSRAGREATRAAILAAARQAWTEHGFDEVGLREIASRAGVTAALVNRYFGTKEALFREAIGTEDPSPAGLADIDPGQFGRVLAAVTLSGEHHATVQARTEHDAHLMLLRSAPSPAAQPVLRDYVENTVMPPLAHYFGGDDQARKRAAAVLALSLGASILGHILRTEPLAQAESEAAGSEADPDLVTVFAAMLQSAADTPLGESR
ncbi:TetR family transcriptional regulator [Micromonospora sp. DR5-3]|uniref:TetR/AcrR family transcriptional regulator n=1 Tax=unclassified Micromonospora TaxID=2617518 RepID=UPI002105DF93|nr:MULTISPECIES: TetR/AcrR family transcriptional regulator [unclassified Micromonospora]MCW3820808.1 TetR family transcriptional regulator [Micromonospora sp. DR5-3]